MVCTEVIVVQDEHGEKGEVLQKSKVVELVIAAIEDAYRRSFPSRKILIELQLITPVAQYNVHVTAFYKCTVSKYRDEVPERNNHVSIGHIFNNVCFSPCNW